MQVQEAFTSPKLAIVKDELRALKQRLRTIADVVNNKGERLLRPEAEIKEVSPQQKSTTLHARWIQSRTARQKVFIHVNPIFPLSILYRFCKLPLFSCSHITPDSKTCRLSDSFGLQMVQEAKHIEEERDKLKARLVLLSKSNLHTYSRLIQE